LKRTAIMIWCYFAQIPQTSRLQNAGNKMTSSRRCDSSGDVHISSAPLSSINTKWQLFVLLFRWTVHGPGTQVSLSYISTRCDIQHSISPAPTSHNREANLLNPLHPSPGGRFPEATKTYTAPRYTVTSKARVGWALC
jgi:hypothetical protein